jgi:hypothetical protein
MNSEQTIPLAQIQQPLGEFKSKFTTGYNPSGSAAGDLTKIVSNALAILTIIAGASFLIYFVMGAINWITSGGDTNKAQAARTIIVNAVLGLAITVIAYPVLLVLSQLLGIPLSEPGELFSSFQ